MSLNATSDGFDSVSELLDELSNAPATALNWRRTLYPLIEHLRAASAPADQIDFAERLSVTLLKLDWAIQKGDSEKQEGARQKLGELRETQQVGLLCPLKTNSKTEALEMVNRPQ